MIWGGLGLAVLGTVLSLIISGLVAQLSFADNSDSQAFHVFVEIILRTVTSLAVPFGAALFAGGLVLASLRKD